MDLHSPLKRVPESRRCSIGDTPPRRRSRCTCSTCRARRYCRRDRWYGHACVSERPLRSIARTTRPTCRSTHMHKIARRRQGSALVIEPVVDGRPPMARHARLDGAGSRLSGAAGAPASPRGDRGRGSPAAWAGCPQRFDGKLSSLFQIVALHIQEAGRRGGRSSAADDVAAARAKIGHRRRGARAGQGWWPPTSRGSG
jgi:hypothetical protein